MSELTSKPHPGRRSPSRHARRVQGGGGGRAACAARPRPAGAGLAGFDQAGGRAAGRHCAGVGRDHNRRSPTRSRIRPVARLQEPLVRGLAGPAGIEHSGGHADPLSLAARTPRVSPHPRRGAGAAGRRAGHLLGTPKASSSWRKAKRPTRSWSPISAACGRPGSGSTTGPTISSSSPDRPTGRTG